MPTPTKTFKTKLTNRSKVNKSAKKPKIKITFNSAIKSFLTNKKALISLIVIFISIASYLLNKLPGRYLNISAINLINQFSLQSNSFKTIYQQNGPYFFISHLIYYLVPNFFALRITNLVFGLLAIIVFYLLVKMLFGDKLAIIASLLLLFNWYSLYNIRAINLSTAILFIGLLVIHRSFKFKRRPSHLNLLFLIISLGLALYFNGLLYLDLVTIIFSLKTIFNQFKKSSLRLKLSYSLISLALILPISYSLTFLKSANSLQSWLALPQNNQHLINLSSFQKLLTNLTQNLSQLFIFPIQHQANLTSLWHTPIVSIALSIIAFIGLIYILPKLTNLTYRISVIILIIGLLMTSLNQKYLLLALAIICLFTTIGLAYLIIIYQKFVPFNPIAQNYFKTLIYGLIGLVIVLNFIASNSFISYNYQPSHILNNAHKLSYKTLSLQSVSINTHSKKNAPTTKPN